MKTELWEMWNGKFVSQNFILIYISHKNKYKKLTPKENKIEFTKSENGIMEIVKRKICFPKFGFNLHIPQKQI